MVASPTKPFQYTAKNTARRQAIIADYDPEIEALYAAVKETTQADMAPPPSWSLPDSINFVKEVVNRVMKHEIQESDDIFQKGCDRLILEAYSYILYHADLRTLACKQLGFVTLYYMHCETPPKSTRDRYQVDSCINILALELLPASFLALLALSIQISVMLNGSTVC